MLAQFQSSLRFSLGLLLLILCLVPLAAQPVEELSVEVLGPFGGDVRSLAIHPRQPDTVFLGTSDSQIFKSLDAGQSWHRLRPGLPQRHLVVDNLHFHPSDPDTLYVGAWETKSDYGALFVTHDGGSSWQEIALGQYQMSIRAIAVAPSDPRVIALGISEGVILSADAGSTWRRVTRGYRSLYNVESLAFDPGDEQILYVGTWRRGWKTMDGGKTWKPMHQGMAFDSDMFSLLVSPEDPQVLFSSACTGVYKSTNGGESWSKLYNGLPKEAKRTRMLHFDPSDASTVYAGTTIGLFKTSDSGGRFDKVHPDIVVNAIAVHPADPAIVLVGADDVGVLRSQDGGASFHESNQGFTHRHISALASVPGQPGLYYAAVASDGLHGGFFITRDKGRHWIAHNQGLGEAAASIRRIIPISRGEVFVVTPQGLFRGHPGNDAWKSVDLPETPPVRDMAPLRDGHRLLLATERGGRLADLERGRLTSIDLGVYEGPVHSALQLSGGGLMLGTDMGVFFSEDDGETWTIRVKGLPYTAVQGLYQTGDNAVVAATPRGLYLSPDRGAEWVLVEGLKRDGLTAVASDSGQRLFAADLGVGYVYSRAAADDSWRRLRLRDTSRVTALAAASDGALLVGTLTDGLCRLEFSSPARLDAGSR
ncbi:MAG TPA: hypothetical protein VLV83_10080 [Acidobacteriota bacterium]|nr:hypothetical protein [Acidobacteriota bacterium]